MTPAIGQVDSVAIDTVDTKELIKTQAGDVNVIDIETYADRFEPRKASLYSAIVPGLGQVYNKRYWKVPIIYGGFIALGFTVDYYSTQHKALRKDLFALKNSDDPEGLSPINGLNETQLTNNIDKFRRERDFYIIMTGLLYLLQIAEAHIDAHLKEFQLNPDLKLSVEPMIDQPAQASLNAGFSLKFKF